MGTPEIEKTREERKQEIANGNDTLRQELLNSILLRADTINPRNMVVMTPGVKESPDIEDILKAVASINTFDPGDDPYGEHDFGIVKVGGESYYFKIDYYDENIEYGVDPYEEEPRRVMTIMRADEY